MKQILLPKISKEDRKKNRCSQVILASLDNDYWDEALTVNNNIKFYLCTFTEVLRSIESLNKNFHQYQIDLSLEYLELLE